MSLITKNHQGVIVECYTEKNQLRVRVISPGYNQSWKVQFPKHLRTQGTRYLVEEIRPVNNRFYRACGQITPYNGATENFLLATPTKSEEDVNREVLISAVDSTKLHDLLATQQWLEPTFRRYLSRFNFRWIRKC